MTNRYERLRRVRKSCLPSNTKLIYAALEDFKGSNAEAYPTLNTLADSLGFSRDKTTRYMRPLLRLKLISRTLKRGASRYKLLEHPFFSGQEFEMDEDEIANLARKKHRREVRANEAKLNGEKTPPKAKPPPPPKASAPHAPLKLVPPPEPSTPTDLERVETAWRATMAKTYPSVPIARSKWTGTNEGKNATEVLIDYSVEQVEKYFAWVVINWGSLINRYAKSKSFPGVPQTIWAKWKASELIAESAGAVGATSAQQAMDVYAEASAWRKANPGKILLPDELAARIANAPKIAGQKL